MEKSSKIRTEKKRRFNFIDVIFLLVILGLMAVIGYVFLTPYISGLSKGTQITLEYTVSVENLREDFNGLIKEKDRVTETNALSDLGEVKSVKYTEKPVFAENPDGILTVCEDEKFYDALITVRAAATEENGCYYVNGCYIGVGKLLSFRVPDYVAEGKCLSVSEK